MDVEELTTKLETLTDEAVSELDDADTEEDLVQTKNRYLGRKGEVQKLLRVIGDLPDADRPKAGRVSNRCKETIEQAYEQRQQTLRERALREKLQREAIDVTLPARRSPARQGHPLRQVQLQLVETFADFGFEIAEEREVETDFYNFGALNFPPDHPARDMQDTFVVEGDGDYLLRTHTSPVQIRTMLAYSPPIQIISPGRVYRCDDDVTHSPVFHQIEGLHVDEHITFTDLKGILEAFSRRTFGQDTPVRFRPSYFPFTEPSAEVDIGCILCDSEGCRVCSHTGWLEILGAGMVDPNVFEAVDIDPDTYSGFAFGLGVERIAMLKYGIDDIRLFFQNDVRFLDQF